MPEKLLSKELENRAVHDIDGFLNILPPRQLYHPYLVWNNKLMFILRFKSAADKNTEQFSHSDGECMIQNKFLKYIDNLRSNESQYYKRKIQENAGDNKENVENAQASHGR